MTRGIIAYILPATWEGISSEIIGLGLDQLILDLVERDFKKDE